jgi:uncharacterized membrane protein YedE/YeeE
MGSSPQNGAGGSLQRTGIASQVIGGTVTGMIIGSLCLLHRIRSDLNYYPKPFTFDWHQAWIDLAWGALSFAFLGGVVSWQCSRRRNLLAAAAIGAGLATLVFFVCVCGVGSGRIAGQLLRTTSDVHIPATDQVWAPFVQVYLPVGVMSGAVASLTGRRR